MNAGNEEFKFTITPEDAKMFISAWHAKAVSCDPYYVAEGLRVADNFRKSFPDVSDHDMGAIVMTFISALMSLGNTPTHSLSEVLTAALESYSSTAASLLSSVSDLG